MPRSADFQPNPGPIARSSPGFQPIIFSVETSPLEGTRKSYTVSLACDEMTITDESQTESFIVRQSEADTLIKLHGHAAFTLKKPRKLFLYCHHGKQLFEALSEWKTGGAPQINREEFAKAEKLCTPSQRRMWWDIVSAQQDLSRAGFLLLPMSIAGVFLWFGGSDLFENWSKSPTYLAEVVFVGATALLMLMWPCEVTAVLGGLLGLLYFIDWAIVGVKAIAFGVKTEAIGIPLGGGILFWIVLAFKLALCLVIVDLLRSARTIRKLRHQFEGTSVFTRLSLIRSLVGGDSAVEDKNERPLGGSHSTEVEPTPSQSPISCRCNHCSGFIAFQPKSLGQLGQEIECPYCGLTTVLYCRSFSTSELETTGTERPSFWRRFTLITGAMIAPLASRPKLSLLGLGIVAACLAGMLLLWIDARREETMRLAQTVRSIRSAPNEGAVQQSYRDPKGRFICNVPAGWNIDEIHDDLLSKVRFHSGPDEIRITAGLKENGFLSEAYIQRVGIAPSYLWPNGIPPVVHFPFRIVSWIDVHGARALQTEMEISEPNPWRFKLIQFERDGWAHHLAARIASTNQSTELLALFDQFLLNYQAGENRGPETPRVRTGQRLRLGAAEVVVLEVGWFKASPGRGVSRGQVSEIPSDALLSITLKAVSFDNGSIESERIHLVNQSDNRFAPIQVVSRAPDMLGGGHVISSKLTLQMSRGARSNARKMQSNSETDDEFKLIYEIHPGHDLDQLLFEYAVPYWPIPLAVGRAIEGATHEKLRLFSKSAFASALIFSGSGTNYQVLPTQTKELVLGIPKSSDSIADHTAPRDPLFKPLLWKDQPFKILLNGKTLGTFAGTSDYTSRGLLLR